MPKEAVSTRRGVTALVCSAALLLVAFVIGGPGTAGADDVEPPDSTTTTTVPEPVALSANEAFVTSAFYDFLNRYPDPVELAELAGGLDTGTSPVALLAGLANSNEWVERTVLRFYNDTLGRAPDVTGLSFWTTAIIDGRMTVAQVAAHFYASDEYFEGIGGNTAESWVTDLYLKLLHRTPEADGLDYWTGQIDTIGRPLVALRMYQSPESCADRVTLLYHQLLHRTPDAGGLEYWAERLVDEGDIALAKHLAASPEYANRAVARFGDGQRPPAPPTGVTVTMQIVDTGGGDSGTDDSAAAKAETDETEGDEEPTDTPAAAEAVVAWNAPADNGGAAVTGYTATATPGGATCSTDDAAETTCTITGLEAGTVYQISVTASGGGSTGAASIPVTAILPVPDA